MRFLEYVPCPTPKNFGGGGALKKKNVEVEFLEILCITLMWMREPSWLQPQQTLLLSHADMAGNHKLGREGDLGVQMGIFRC